MRHDAAKQSWLSFLNDLDVIAVVPYGSSQRLIELAGKESVLRRKHSIYLDVVTVASAPEDYPTRMVALYPGRWERLQPVCTRSARSSFDQARTNFERDRTDVEHLAHSGYLNAATLRQRYRDEMRANVIGRQSWHDQTLEMWISAFFPAEPED